MILNADQLRYLRSKHVLSLRDLSARSGVGRAALSLYEREVRNPRPRTIRKLAVALEVEPETLILWDDDPEVAPT